MASKNVIENNWLASMSEHDRLQWLHLAEMFITRGWIDVNNTNDVLALAEYLGKWLQTGERER